MRAALLAGLATVTLAAPAAAQHAGHNMPGMTMPTKPAAKATPKRKPAAKPVARKAQPHTAPKPAVRKAPRPAGAAKAAPAADPHAGHNMGAAPVTAPDDQTTPADPHAGHDMGGASMQQGGQAASTPADPHAGHQMPDAAQAGQPAPADPHAGHGVTPTRQGDNVSENPHAGHDMGSGATADHSAPIGTNLPAGGAPAPKLSEEEARAAAEQLGGVTVVKAQVKTGGRGKAGGVKVAKTPEEAEAAARAILGLDIKGHVVSTLMVAAGADIAEEYYVSLLLDRAERRYLALASKEGGVEIEVLAVERPEALARVAVDPVVGGAINRSGAITFRATRVGADTALAQIVALVQRAQDSKAPANAWPTRRRSISSSWRSGRVSRRSRPGPSSATSGSSWR